MKELLAEDKSFAFETTLSGLIYPDFIKRAKEKGYTIIFFFIYLNNVNLAKERVAVRISKGGHNIPEDVIEGRYYKGLQNFSNYAIETNDWYVYDNSGNEYELVAKSVDKEKINSRPSKSHF